jgi:alcohol oxidase
VLIPQYSSLADLGVLRWAYKKGREISRRMASYRGEFEPGHPRYPEGSQAACKASTGPVDASSPDLIYSAEDNVAIDTYHRENSLYTTLEPVALLTAF